MRILVIRKENVKNLETNVKTETWLRVCFVSNHLDLFFEFEFLVNVVLKLLGAVALCALR